jgi:hypothetical protein
MRARPCLFACTLPACWQEIHSPGCSEPVVTELADDEPSPLGTSANDLLAIATPGWTGRGVYASASEVDVSFAVERGEGPARFLDTEEIDIVTRVRGMGGDQYLLLAVVCTDALQVPATFSLLSEEADVALDMDATLSSPVFPPIPEDVDLDLFATEPYAESGVDVPDIDPSLDDQTLEARVEILADGTSAGAVSWLGSSDTYARSVPLLEWPAD